MAFGDVQALTLPEVVRLARESGIDTSQRTVRLYVDAGIIPKPDVRSRDEGGRTGYYDRRVLQILRIVPILQEQGYSLRDIESILERFDGIASQSGKDPITTQIAGLEAIASKTSEKVDPGRSTRSSTTGRAEGALSVWKSLSGPVVAEMLRRGMSPDTEKISELTVMVNTRDGERFSLPVFLDVSSVTCCSPLREHDSELASVTSAYASELWGKAADSSVEGVRRWLEESYDMSRANFIVAWRDDSAHALTGIRDTRDGQQAAGQQVTGPQAGGQQAAGQQAAGPEATERSIIGFVALGVEPERLRAGQVRLEGPYVVPEYRTLGLARGLMHRAESRALELGAAYVDAFVDSQAGQAISFLRHFGYIPDHFYWEAHVDLPEVFADGDDPLAERSRDRRKLEIRPTASAEELEQALSLVEQVMKGKPGYYRARADDLVAFGTSFPMPGHFCAYLDGELVGNVWNSPPSARVYAVVLPRYSNTWIERALWRHILRYLRSKGMKTARTEAVSEVASRHKALSALGFTVDKMTVSYRKRLRSTGETGEIDRDQHAGS